MRYLLENPAFINDTYLEAGTEIGDDTPYLLPDGFVPNASMKPLDNEATDLTNKVRKDKPNWGRPEDNIPIRPPGDIHPIDRPFDVMNRQAQPIIPPPLEHLTHPNDAQPGEHLPRPNPLLEEALRKQNERLAAENDKRMAEKANREADEKSKMNLPHGVTVDNTGAKATAQPAVPGQGPQPKTPTQSGIPGQGPATVKNQPKPADPKPASQQVPRNTSTLTPESDDGKPRDLSKDKKD